MNETTAIPSDTKGHGGAIRSAEVEDSYVLTPMQEGMLFHSVYEPQAGMYIRQMVYSLREGVNAGALRRAWQAVMRRHQILRTSLRWENLETPVQEVWREVMVPFESQDWQALSPTEQRRRLEEHLACDRRRGFDLTAAPLMRLLLLRFGTEDYRLIWTFHHILSDGRSDVLVSKEVFEHYEAFCEGRELQLPEAPSYRNHGAWLRQQDTAAFESFWRRTLSGFTTPTYVGTRPAAEDLCDRDEGRAEKTLRLPSPLTAALHLLAHERGLTLNAILQGAWALLLSRYTGEADVVFGVVRACRRSALGVPDSENVVGPFVNSLPMRVRVSPEMPVSEWLGQLRGQWLVLRDYEQTPLQKVQEWSDLPHGAQLFDSVIGYERRSMNSTLGAQVKGWETRELRTIQARTNFPLTIAVYGEAELLVVFNYDPLHLTGDAVERMIGHMRRVLESILSAPEQPLRRMEMLTASERRRLLIEWNQTQNSYPREAALQQLFERQVERTPDAIALVCGGERLTYAELNARANRLAHHLRDLGVRPGALVGLMLSRSTDMVVAFLGALKSGAAYLPLDPDYPSERLSFMLRDARAELLLTEEQFAEGRARDGVRTIYLDTQRAQWESSSAENLRLPFVNETAYVLYTSGSTGSPKAVVCRHAGVINILTSLERADPLSPGERCSLWTGQSFDVSVYEEFTSLLFGGELHIVPDTVRVETAKFIEWLRAEQIQCAYVPPFMLGELAEWLGCDDHTLSLCRLLTGVELINELTLASIRQSLPNVTILNCYGPTETTICSTFIRFEPQQAQNKNASIGRPADNTQVYLLDGGLTLVPEGAAGEVYIGGDGLAQGYLRRPALTAGKFIPDPFGGEPGRRLYKTGDLARYLPDGNIEFVGRIDKQVKLRGFRIELGEIESALKQLEEVSDVAVLLWEDGSGGKYLVAYVVARQPQGLTTESLRNHLREHLPEYMVPSVFVVLERLPLTPNHKVDRKALPPPDLEAAREGESYQAPRTEIEEVLCAIWCGVLGRQAVSVHDKFFELGGHSLQVAQVASKAREAFQLELDIRKFFNLPTVADQAVMVEEEMLKEVEGLSDEEVECLVRDNGR